MRIIVLLEITASGHRLYQDRGKKVLSIISYVGALSPSILSEHSMVGVVYCVDQFSRMAIGISVS